MSNRFADRRAGHDEWLTPPDIIKALGAFGLDPCAPVVRPWPTALHHLTVNEDGMRQPWYGRVWLNPPYGRETGRWLRKLADHGNGIALTFARTETAMFHAQVWERASAVFFLRGRLRFFNVDGSPAANTAAAPSCLIAYGIANVFALRDSGLAGKLVQV